jgi:hypothetical protein
VGSSEELEDRRFFFRAKEHEECELIRKRTDGTQRVRSAREGGSR